MPKVKRYESAYYVCSEDPSQRGYIDVVDADDYDALYALAKEMGIVLGHEHSSFGTSTCEGCKTLAKWEAFNA